MGISLLDCIDPDIKSCCGENLISRFTTKAARLVAIGDGSAAELRFLSLISVYR